ncbi:MAG TPA: hypothetical protein VMT18_16330, partial [Planctomycetota bacterium]|nr:hypothetical protein [Planctomycetota bacterium]
MNWRSWFAHILVPSLALLSCAGAAPRPVPAARPAPELEAPAQPVHGEAPAVPSSASPAPTAAPAEQAAQAAQVAPGAPDEVPVPAEPPAAVKRNPWLDDERLEGMFVFDRGAGNLPVAVARDEELTMNVRVRLGIAGSPRLGTVTMTSRVVPHRGSVMVRDAETETGLERAELIAFAKGGNALYHLEEERRTLLLPQAWPHIRHTSVQTGTESRKREQDIGWGEDGYHTRFRGDHHCGGCELRQHFVEPTWAWQDPRHCRKCKRAEHRVWREWQDRPVPEGTLDMVTAVTLGRSMLLLGESEL